ncbi:unnamed protein product [Nezara viridula]|uniref:Uncharacterized protein n=1 Tax=Nezara viridula TaxID=85310 RepID=A0A9P0H827_NEZVI|nr:unnamed protein product [Nezara viridula]
MVKSIHDLSEEEIGNLSKEIKELLKGFKQKQKNKQKNEECLNWDDFELSSWLTSATEESKETNENLIEMSKNFSRKKSKEVIKEQLNPKLENNSLSTESLENSETYNIEDLIKTDETLKELKKLTSILEEDINESVSNENESSGSSASRKKLIVNKQSEKSKNLSIAPIRIKESSPLESDGIKSVEKDSKLKITNAHTKTDKNILNTKLEDLKLDSKAKKMNSGSPVSKQQAENNSKTSASDFRPRKMSNSSIKNKKKYSTKESIKLSTESLIKKIPYLEGFPEYEKGHHVPIISKHPENELRTRASSAEPYARSFSTVTNKPEEVVPRQAKKHVTLLIKKDKNDEFAPIFPLKIDCISMFSDDEEIITDEGSEEEESDSESDSGPGEPDVMLNELWKDLLLPSDESDMDLDEFYKQFPKLKKKNQQKECSREYAEVHFKSLA